MLSVFNERSIGPTDDIWSLSLTSDELSFPSSSGAKQRKLSYDTAAILSNVARYVNEPRPRADRETSSLLPLLLKTIMLFSTAFLPLFLAVLNNLTTFQPSCFLSTTVRVMCCLLFYHRASFAVQENGMVGE